MQQVLAVFGIGVGVGLLLAGQVASESLDGPVRALGDRLLASAQFQLVARSPQGFSESVLLAARGIPGVLDAAPVLEQRVVLRGASGSSAVDLVGLASDPAGKSDTGLLGSDGAALQLPARVASALGASLGDSVSVRVGAEFHRAVYAASLSSASFGALRDSQIALASLQQVQRLATKGNRVTRIFVHIARGAADARRALSSLAAKAHLNLLPADADVRAFELAAAPAQNAERLFAVISAVVGFLLAFNAMLLTAPERRGLLLGLRRRGWTRAAMIRLLCLDVAAIAVPAGVLGVALAYLFSRTLFGQEPAYLSFAFPVGSGRQLTFPAIAVSVLGGVLAAGAGVLGPLAGTLGLDAGRRSRHPGRDRRPSLRIAATSSLLVAAALIAAIRPGEAVFGSFALLAALLLILPLVLPRAVELCGQAIRRVGTLAGRLAVIELRDQVVGTRFLAVAATGAVAVFGSTSVLGARANLKHGLDETSAEWSELSPLWVYLGGSQNTLLTMPFESWRARQLAKLADVASVRVYQGGFLDVGDRRLWVIAPPAGGQMLAVGQLVTGSPAAVERRLAGHGWAVISSVAAMGLHVGERLALPTPRPVSLRIAGLSTNSGWPPGILVMSAADFARAFQTSEPTALAVRLRAGVPPSRGRSEIAAKLGHRGGLVVRTSAERASTNRASTAQALAQLGEIATLVLAAAALAMAGVMGSAIWQRRRHVVALKRQGYTRGLLWRMLLLECAIVTGVGCVLGGLFGLFGQLLLSYALQSVTGFPIDVAVDPLVGLLSLGVVCGAASAILAVPGYVMVRATSVRRA